VGRGTTGAPRNTPRSTIPADRLEEPSGGAIGRLTGIVCGRRTKYFVVAFWILLIAAAGSFAGKLTGTEQNDASAYLPASAESTQEIDAQDLFQSKNLNPAVVVYLRPSGVTAADPAKADPAKADPAKADPAKADPAKADPAQADPAKADLGYNAGLGGFVAGVKSAAAGGQRDPGRTAYVAGPAANAADEVKIFKGIDSTLLYATLAVVVVLLLLTYRSPVLSMLPIMSAGAALTAAEAAIYWLTQHANLTVNGQNEGILVVLVIGASTDYALLLIARYREEVRRHADRHAAMAVALRRAAPAIIASGLTVVAGMLCLLAIESNDISGLGPVAAIGIAVGLVAMVTLLPALLVISGRRVFWPARPGIGTEEPTSRGLWSRVGGAIGRCVWWPSSLARARAEALGAEHAA
jgi:RND superfamily putative drug exporter